ncbi:MAG: hypothetical protein LKE40_00480 [Spirochaetia bacterium]|jgi:hypothetical protein|nr:hypothetical protein [Spirochaetia bacterium]
MKKKSLYNIKEHRLALCCLLCMLGMSAANASAYSLFDGNFRFDWVASNALFPTAIADPFAASSSLKVLQVKEGTPRYLYKEKSDGSFTKENLYGEGSYTDKNLYLQLKTGVNIGFFRVSLFDNKIQSELTLQGGLNSVFQGFGGADNLGYDGIFFIGANARLFDMVTFRAGLQHYSGHYGDETIENAYDHDDTLLADGSLVDYCRDNDVAIGMSLTPLKPLRLYATASLPKESSWISPHIVVPSWVRKPSSGVLYGYNDYDQSYKDWIMQGGIEYAIPIPTVGSLTLAADMKFYQDGQIEDMFTSSPSYDADNPWETDYTVGGALVFPSGPTGLSARLEVFYHDGRFPLLNFFYQRTRYVSIGFSVAE